MVGKEAVASVDFHFPINQEMLATLSVVAAILTNLLRQV